MSEAEERKKTPHDTLIQALERVEEMESVIVIYDKKNEEKCGSFDSDLTVSECLFLIELFKHWLMSKTLGE